MKRYPKRGYGATDEQKQDLINSWNRRTELMLKEQEESIPISWLKEKLEGHPELSYAVTDGIINILDLWKGR